MLILRIILLYSFILIIPKLHQSCNGQTVKNFQIGNYQTYLDRAIYVRSGYIVVLSNSSSQTILIKYDHFGNQIWSKEFSAGNISKLFDICDGPSENLYCLVGDNLSRVKVIKLDVLGNEIWTKLIDPTSLYMSKSLGRIKSDSLENIYIAPPILDEVFIQKFDSSGAVIYSTYFSPDTTSNYYIRDFQILNDGGVIGIGDATVAHYFRLDSLGNIIWSKLLKDMPNESQFCHSIFKTSSGKYIISGLLFIYFTNELRTILNEIDINGNIITSTEYYSVTNPDYIAALNIYENSNNEILLCGVNKFHNVSLVTLDNNFAFTCFYELPISTFYLALHDFTSDEILYTVRDFGQIIRMPSLNPTSVCNLSPDYSFVSNSYYYDTSLISHDYYLLIPPNTISDFADLSTFPVIDSVICGGYETPAQVENLESIISINIFPNPASHILHVENNSNFNSITIYNSNGQLIRKYQSNISLINISDIPSGLYLIRFESENQIFIKKFIKE